MMVGIREEVGERKREWCERERKREKKGEKKKRKKKKE